MLVVVLFIITLFGSTTGTEPCPTYPYYLPPSINFENNNIIQDALAKLDLFLSQKLKEDNLPGFIAIVTYNQQTVWSKGYGKRDFFKENSPPPSADDLVMIASITKLFTSLLLYYSRDKGIVDLDDPISKFIPYFNPKNPYNTKRELTLRELSSHSSGLQRETPFDCQAIECTTEKVVEALNSRWLILPQYNTPHYSNLGFALLGRTLEIALKQKYENVVTENILKPLGMFNSTYTVNQTVISKAAVGVDFTPNGTAYPVEIQSLGWDNPGGGLLASANDMSKFMSLFFRQNNTAGGAQIVDGATIAEILTAVLMTHDGTTGFGSPWEFNYTAKYWTKSKAGELQGYRSNLAIVPPLKLGIFISALISDTPDPTTYTMSSLDILIPAFEKVLESFYVPPLPTNYENFVGNYYTSDKVYLLSVSLNGKTLKAALTATYGGVVIEEMDLTAVEFDETVLRVRLSPPLPVCRWLDDGANEELAYFTFPNKQSKATSVTILNQTFYRN